MLTRNWILHLIVLSLHSGNSFKNKTFWRIMEKHSFQLTKRYFVYEIWINWFCNFYLHSYIKFSISKSSTSWSILKCSTVNLNSSVIQPRWLLWPYIKILYLRRESLYCTYRCTITQIFSLCNILLKRMKNLNRIYAYFAFTSM